MPRGITKLMEPKVVALLTVAAIAHATWNLTTKRSLDKQVFLFLSIIVSCAVYFVPFVFVWSPTTPAGWFFVLISGAAEAVYYMLLGSAYQRGDLSLVYPVARGSAPVFVALGARVVLGERISHLGLLGVLITVLGVYVVHLKSLRKTDLLGPLAASREAGSRLALLTGVVIASYSVIDKAGVRHVRPAPYLYMVLVISAVLLAPYMWTKKREAIREEWQRNARSIVLVGVMNVATYLTVLFAMTLSKVSYVSSVREMSVVFGAALGALVLREPFGRQKVAGAMLVFAGVVCISMAR